MEEVIRMKTGPRKAYGTIITPEKLLRLSKKYNCWNTVQVFYE
jgi:hypothetical protein